MRTLLAVHAHPDDETITMGGTLARYSAAGIRTVLVCCTRGEEGEIHDPTLDPVVAQPRLGELREAELRAAAAILGVHDLHFLGYRDSGMPGSAGQADPRAFVNAALEEAAGRLAAIIRSIHPHVVVTYDRQGGYGHRDHVMTHRVTRRALEHVAEEAEGAPSPRLYYPAVAEGVITRINEAMRARGLEAPFRSDNMVQALRQALVPDARVVARLAVTEQVSQVLEALRAHRTQIPAGDPFLTLPHDLATVLFGHDDYIADGYEPSEGPVDSLFP